MNHVADKMSEQFTTFYYNTFDADRKGLAALYVHAHGSRIPQLLLIISFSGTILCLPLRPPRSRA